MKKRFRYSEKNTILILCWFLLLTAKSFSQSLNQYQYVNPFIGTANSDAFTKWGNEGGTYPGAVAPSGFIQLSPETRITGPGGYNYTDSNIYFFSCFNHSSGFPGGSSGQFHIMPVDDLTKEFNPDNYHRPFSHQSEKAEPGYYKVVFSDNGTIAEAAAAKRSGMFRFTFLPGVVPKIFIRQAGEINFLSDKILIATLPYHIVMDCSKGYIEKEKLKDGYLLSFPSSGEQNVIILKISASTVSNESAQKNMSRELNATSFEQLREHTKKEWIKALSVVAIDDSNEQNKTIFFTALYHSLLVPWIISDVDGNYRGRDRLIHKRSGENEYGHFSPWDTFRSLHPLLCLLYPNKESDIILSMLDIFRQTHYLPTESMTGNHAVPVIVDAYLKGIRGIDTTMAYEAMKANIVQPPFKQDDMEVYHEKGYIPFLYPESVTRTVEYAYDDWALAQFAKQVMHHREEYDALLNGSFSYRNLFDAEELSFLPRNENEFRLHPGNAGYKEGDQFVYSYFVPQNPKDLINLMGGDSIFASRLDAAFTDQEIVFDNETVFHIPYLFNEANHAWLTQKWVSHIMHDRFKASPGGLPGNDDLGAVSSWYVFSAMGIFPLCPGRPDYTIGSPLFRSLTLHLGNGKNFIIKNNHPAGQNAYIQSLTVNHNAYTKSSITHALLMRGGEMDFIMSNAPQFDSNSIRSTTVFSETKNKPAFSISGFSVSKKEVKPDEPFKVYFTIRNSGSMGTKIVKLFFDGHEYEHKNCLVGNDAVVKDSIICRLYPFGKSKINIEGLPADEIKIAETDKAINDEPELSDLNAIPMLSPGETQQISFEVKNIGGATRHFQIPVTINDSLICSDTLTLCPGEKKLLSNTFKVYGSGIQKLKIKNLSQPFRIFQSNKDTKILDLSFDENLTGSIVRDHSGFGNNGNIIRAEKNTGGLPNDSLLLFSKDCFVEIPNSPSLDKMGETITMMLWVYPTAVSNGLTDIFTKGDNHVIQIVGNASLSFFAGGWGRGDCTVALPVDWVNHWHHLAGVCYGKKLELYIDGALKGTTLLETTVNLSVTNKWVLGRNEEFPFQRVFNGYIRKAKVFAKPLSAEEIKEVMNK